MKLPLLLTQFLYQHKKLNLPGIGSFTLDPSFSVPEDADKHPEETIQGIEFNHTTIPKADEDLIDFIKLHTGKIRPLAEADLESYLALGIQLLNIGKPFYLEGIGAITKTKEGLYEFTPGSYSTYKIEDLEAESKERSEKKKSVFEEQHDEYAPQTNRLRTFLLTVGILGGLALIAWGGYSLYKKNTYPESNNNENISSVKKDTTTVQKDSTTSAQVQSQTSADTAKSRKPAETPVVYTSGDSVLYKYVVLETDKKYKALKRYNQLLSYQLKIKMDTKDSSFFKLYFTFPALTKDTVRIKDSLNRTYATKVFIER
ncbi:MAG: hypothetical protein JST87_04570 [Bacteroidetes bacterium]|nr:hypothetical protein [Bacteroidota bacterium]